MQGMIMVELSGLLSSVKAGGFVLGILRRWPGRGQCLTKMYFKISGIIFHFQFWHRIFSHQAIRQVAV